MLKEDIMCVCVCVLERGGGEVKETNKPQMQFPVEKFLLICWQYWTKKKKTWTTQEVLIDLFFPPFSSNIIVSAR
jgi:hypothetical protein